jgi:predicted nucleic acid-binding protein
MKTKIGSFKNPRTSIPIGIRDIINLEMVLSRHIQREYRRRLKCPQWEKTLQRMDIRDAVEALRKIKSTPLEYTYVD